jgi:hypothetical protein
MKKLGCGISLFAASLTIGFSQVGVEVKLDNEQFLSGEAVRATVRISNNSGQPLHLGMEEGWLTFSIQSSGGGVVAKLGDVPVTGEIVLESAKVGIKHVDLAPYFALEQPGNYQVVANVRIKAWNYEATSSPKAFDIVPGAKLWEQEVGVPSTNANAVPELRKYVLQQANYLKNRLGLYLRVSDATTGRPLRVFPIGRLLSFSQPEAQVDKISDLHLLYQDGPRSFSYTVFNPEGDLLVRQSYDYYNTRPRLRPDVDGNIVVFGGMRHFTPNDEPPPPPAAAPPPDQPPSAPNSSHDGLPPPKP